MTLLVVENLSVDFDAFHAVENLSLSIEESEVVGIVGESGSGKSVSMLALMGLIPYPGKVSASRLEFNGTDLGVMSERERRRIVGNDIAMVFQEPMTSLNPCFTVGFQIMETLKVHEGGPKRQRRDRTVELLEQVGIPAAGSRLNAFPHQLSGGMNQRVMIAMAIACNPKLLIADEPTTALDVTIQAQILDLLLSLQSQRQMALVLITHNMGVVAETARKVAVMYAGQIVEQNSVEALFRDPRHPYTCALLNALPERNPGRARLPTIPGVVPGPYNRPDGCLFHPRCGHAQSRCKSEAPPLERTEKGTIRCHYPLGTGP